MPVQDINEYEIKDAFRNEYSEDYLNALSKRFDYIGGGSIAELLYAAFATGYIKALGT